MAGVTPKHRSRLAADVAGGRDLVVLVDGPWVGCWYWADNWAAVQRAARRFPPSHPSGELARYEATEERVAHPDRWEPGIYGTVWIYV
jgi:hypothetical protein